MVEQYPLLPFSTVTVTEKDWSHLLSVFHVHDLLSRHEQNQTAGHLCLDHSMFIVKQHLYDQSPNSQNTRVHMCIQWSSSFSFFTGHKRPSMFSRSDGYIWFSLTIWLNCASTIEAMFIIGWPTSKFEFVSMLSAKLNSGLTGNMSWVPKHWLMLWKMVSRASRSRLTQKSSCLNSSLYWIPSIPWGGKWMPPSWEGTAIGMLGRLHSGRG